MFDPQAFIEAIGAVVEIIVQASVVAATTTQTSVTVGQGGTNNLQGFSSTSSSDIHGRRGLDCQDNLSY